MTRFTQIAAALVGTVMLLSPIAGQAQAPASGYYTATPVAQPTKTSFVTHTTVWKWSENAFVAGKAPERENVVCELIAQRVGKLNGFTAAGRSFDADALAKCNAHAK
ncbi:MAG: hypothetical protein ABI240_10905 [Sphingomonas sp.]